MAENKVEAPKETEYKISVELAELELDGFAKAMDLDLDPSGKSDEDKADMLDSKRTVIRAIRKGSVVIEGGLPTFTPQRSEDTTPVTFYEPTGATLMAIDKARAGEDVSKTFKVLVDLTKTTTPKTFAKMKLNDVKVCVAIMGLFMG